MSGGNHAENNYMLKSTIILAVLLVFVFAADAIPTLGGVLGENPVLSANIRVLPEYKIVAAGTAVHYSIAFTNLGNAERADITLAISAINEETGERAAYTQETLAIETTLSLSRSLAIPSDTTSGDYELLMEVKYDSSNAAAADTFEVIEPAKTQEEIAYAATAASENLLVAAIIIIIIIFIVIFFVEHRHLHRIHGDHKVKEDDIRKVMFADDHSDHITKKEYEHILRHRKER